MSIGSGAGPAIQRFEIPVSLSKKKKCPAYRTAGPEANFNDIR
jgi:hypothetical protein